MVGYGTAKGIPRWGVGHGRHRAPGPFGALGPDRAFCKPYWPSWSIWTHRANRPDWPRGGGHRDRSSREHWQHWANRSYRPSQQGLPGGPGGPRTNRHRCWPQGVYWPTGFYWGSRRPRWRYGSYRPAGQYWTCRFNNGWYRRNWSNTRPGHYVDLGKLVRREIE